MTPGRGWRLVAAASLAAAASSCGLGSGPSSPGEATLTVTRDYGSERVLEATDEDPPESETVIRFLDREAEIETRYGGGFVQAIDGIAGTVEGGRSYDWFFYVNGSESPVGAAEADVRGGDRIWWDHRDWTDAMRVPAVVGSWPEPFAQASSEGGRLPVRVECAGERAPCSEVVERLDEEGIDAARQRFARGGGSPEALRLLVGSWGELRADPAAAQLEEGPADSGVFAEMAPERGAGYALVQLDDHGDPASRLNHEAGLVAALRLGEDPPTWVVTGTDEPGVAAAAELLDETDLEGRYAVVAVAGRPARPLPLPRASPRAVRGPR